VKTYLPTAADSQEIHKEIFAVLECWQGWLVNCCRRFGTTHWYHYRRPCSSTKTFQKSEDFNFATAKPTTSPKDLIFSEGTQQFQSI